jgi:hypothetical protein
MIWSKLGKSITIPQNAAASICKRWKAWPNKFENSDGRLTDPPCPRRLLFPPAPAALLSRDTSVQEGGRATLAVFGSSAPLGFERLTASVSDNQGRLVFRSGQIWATREKLFLQPGSYDL